MKKYQIYGIFAVLFLFLFHAVYGIAFFYKNYHIKDTSTETKFVGHVMKKNKKFVAYCKMDGEIYANGDIICVDSEVRVELLKKELYKNCSISIKDYFIDIREEDAKIMHEEENFSDDTHRLFSYDYRNGDIGNIMPNYTAVCGDKTINTVVDRKINKQTQEFNEYYVFVSKTDLEKFKTEYYQNKEKTGFVEKIKSATLNYFEYWLSITFLLYIDISEFGTKT